MKIVFTLCLLAVACVHARPQGDFFSGFLNFLPKELTSQINEKVNTFIPGGLDNLTSMVSSGIGGLPGGLGNLTANLGNLVPGGLGNLTANLGNLVPGGFANLTANLGNLTATLGKGLKNFLPEGLSMDKLTAMIPQDMMATMAPGDLTMDKIMNMIPKDKLAAAGIDLNSMGLPLGSADGSTAGEVVTEAPTETTTVEEETTTTPKPKKKKKKKKKAKKPKKKE